MRTHDGYDARDSYEHARDAMGENVNNGNDDIESNGRRFQETPSDVAATMRSLIKAQEEQVVRFGKVSCGSAMRTHDGYDAQDSYEHA